MSSKSAGDDTTERANAANQQPRANRLRRFAVSVLRICLLAYVTISITLVVMESRLVYPGAYSDGTDSPAAASRLSDISAITYTDPRGVEHTGRLISPPGAHRYVLLLHGNASQARSIDDWTRQIAGQMNAVVLAAEYRGFDGTDFTPHEASVVEDSIAAIDELCRRYRIKPTDVVVYGRSLGGGAAAAVAESRGAGVVVLERAFDKLYRVAAGRYPLIPVSLLMRNRYDSIERLQDFTGPVIQIHGRTDQLIPIEHAESLAATINSENFQWIEVPVLGHNDPLPATVSSRITEFVKTAMPETSPNLSTAK